MLRTRLAFCAALALAPSFPGALASGAQASGPRLQPAPGGPLRVLSIDARSGAIRPGPAVAARALGDVIEFSNLDLGGFVGFDTGAGCEWFDAGVKGRGNASDLMSQVTFAYCARTPTGTVTLGFYEGYTPGGATPSTNVGLFTLSGLPGTTLAGGFACYWAQVNFDPLVCFADGPIGYSWRFDPVQPLLPFMACVQSCSGPGPDGNGVIDQLDRRCPPSPALTPFTFPGFVSSIAMEIREAADMTASVAPFLGDGVNSDTLTAGAIVLGQPWAVTVGIGHPHGAGGPLALRVRTLAVNGANVTSPVGGRTTERLIGGPLLATLSGAHDGLSGSFPVVAVPRSGALLGQEWAAQATVLGGGFADLSLAAAGVIGTE